MASRSHSQKSSTGSSNDPTRSMGAHRTPEPTEESEPFEDTESHSPVYPTFHMPCATGPRTRQTARKWVGRLPTGQLARRDAELVRSRSYHVGGPSSPMPIDPAENAHRRASIDLSVQGQIWSVLRSHHGQLQHLRQTEYETYLSLQETNEFMERHDREIAQLQEELKALKNKKGFSATAWDWIRRRH